MLHCDAGQAIVQMAHSKFNARDEYAVKFFMSRSDFDTEVQQYQTDNPLRKFLPKVCLRSCEALQLLSCCSDSSISPPSLRQKQ